MSLRYSGRPVASCAGLALPCASSEEFDARLNALYDVLNRMAIALTDDEEEALKGRPARSSDCGRAFIAIYPTTNTHASMRPLGCCKTQSVSERRCTRGHRQTSRPGTSPSASRTLLEAMTRLGITSVAGRRGQSDPSASQ